MSHYQYNNNVNFTIILTPIDIIKKNFPENLSWTYTISKNHYIVYINEYRWNFGSKKLNNIKIKDYRKYVINHEIGHVIGLDHKKCNLNKSNKSPIMMQQTKGTGLCEFNPYP